MAIVFFQPERHLIARALRENSDDVTGKVLDLGAGGFERYRHLFPRATTILRMDIVPHKDLDLISSAECLSINHGSLDTIVSTQVLEHVAHPGVVIEECFRVLRRSGRLLFTVPQIGELHEEPHDYFRFTSHGLKTLLEERGFVDIQTHPIGGFFTMMAQLNIRFLINRFRLGNGGYRDWIFKFPVALIGRLAMVLDGGEVGSKFPLGWLVRARKP